MTALLDGLYEFWLMMTDHQDCFLWLEGELSRAGGSEGEEGGKQQQAAGRHPSTAAGKQSETTENMVASGGAHPLCNRIGHSRPICSPGGAPLNTAATQDCKSKRNHSNKGLLQKIPN